MAAPNQPFSAQPGATKSIAVGTADSFVTFPNSVNDGRPKNVVMLVVGAQTVFVRISDATDLTIASVTADTPIPNAFRYSFTVGFQGPFTVHAIAAAAGSTLYITPGDGW